MRQICTGSMGGSKKKPLGSEKSSPTSGHDGDKPAKKEETKKALGKVQQKQKLSVLVEDTQGRRVYTEYESYYDSRRSKSCGRKNFCS